jgi:hypothetical protein
MLLLGPGFGTTMRTHVVLKFGIASKGRVANFHVTRTQVTRTQVCVFVHYVELMAD